MDNLVFEKEVAAAVDCLRKGKVILYPTDTVWGIGCDATNKTAIEKIYAIN
jgi:L-threonylcarbamoyladenylate synthase